MSCDVQSSITKQSVEKYLPTPTPSISPTPTEMPIDPADVVTVDTSVEGKPISINGPLDKKVVCTKYNQVMVNSSDNVTTIKGACRQIMINGHRNKITVDATTEIVINGNENNITYSRFVNGKRPRITENQSGSVVEKISAPTRK
jgi:hypothetical protein